MLQSIYIQNYALIDTLDGTTGRYQSDQERRQ